MTGAPGPSFDGRTYPYVPPRRPPESVAPLLHAERGDVDPTTFEVLRHALWNLNMEHGNAIIRTSGSPVVVYAHDFNPVILDEAGDYVFFGPWLQYLVAATSPAVKWILEHRHPRPGIEPGCMFMSNDPWIGATHQSDLTMLAPVFWEDRVFAWVGNSLHHQDLGGTAPGGFNPVASDVFWESGIIPPVRVVEDGELRVNLEEEFMRRSRMPELVAVNLRAQIAGCKVAVARMETLLGRYGPETVKGVMKKIQDDSEAAFLRRLETIPDGEWREEAFLEMATPGDRALYRNSLVLRKSGDRLEFSNEGTDPQIGTLGCTLAAWSGAIGAMVNAQLMFDQLFAIQGALRHIDFRAEPGTLTSALHPSALSLAPLTLDQCIALAGLCISKMLSASSDPELQKEGGLVHGLHGLPDRRLLGRVRERPALRHPVPRGRRRGAGGQSLEGRHRRGRLALGPPGRDAERRGVRVVVPDPLPLEAGAARLGRRRALPRRQQHGPGRRGARRRDDRPPHGLGGPLRRPRPAAGGRLPVEPQHVHAAARHRRARPLRRRRGAGRAGGGRRRVDARPCRPRPSACPRAPATST